MLAKRTPFFNLLRAGLAPLWTLPIRGRFAPALSHSTDKRATQWDGGVSGRFYSIGSGELMLEGGVQNLRTLPFNQEKYIENQY